MENKYIKINLKLWRIFQNKKANARLGNTMHAPAWALSTAMMVTYTCISLQNSSGQGPNHKDFARV